MICYQLDKQITLYRHQFEKFSLSVFGDYRLSRYSLDLDGLSFKMKYIAKHYDSNSDIYQQLPDLQKKYVESSVNMQTSFQMLVKRFIDNVITIPQVIRFMLMDVLVFDVSFDPNYVKFTIRFIASDKRILEYFDVNINSGPIDMYPGEYFRFNTDSYNDGIAKAYPELFVNRHVDGVGKGADGDIFCHSFTFQTTEKCSLNCSYCVAAGTQILMADGSYKNIEDVRLGDYVMGFDESDYIDEPASDFYPVRVNALFLNDASCFKITSKELTGDLYITPNHKVLTDLETWTPVEELDKTVPIMVYSKIFFNQIYNYVVKRKFTNEQLVYNLETDSHTYIANNLCVHNCYQFNKSPMKMTFETAKTFIDHLLNDDYGYINRYNSPAIIIEFIGGEPLLEINLTRQIYEYFLQRTLELNHPWFTLHRLSICSNGMQYFNKEVQDFFKEYATNISFNISIDGNKELHDACRRQPNGEGSYDIDMAALNHFNKHYTAERNSKMTLSPENISHLYDSVVDFISKGMRVININCVFEEGWTPETANEEYMQLKRLADYLIDTNQTMIYVAIFNERQEDRQLKEIDSNGCGGTGSMLALRPNGQFYPCLRYMPSSVGNNVKDLCIGTVKDGIIGRDQDSEILDMLDSVTRRSQTTDICYECPISNDCPNCSALSHTVFGTPDKRTTFACIQFIAEALANVYYWNRLLLKHPDWKLSVRRNVVPDQWAEIILPKEELDELKLLEATAIAVSIENS